jgi:hypothetical protein
VIVNPIRSFPFVFENLRAQDNNAVALATAGVNLAIAEIDPGNVSKKKKNKRKNI